MADAIDLHTHSTASDGIYTPTELLHHAQAAGIAVMALTDHDSTEGLDEAAQAARELHIELVPGIEINTDISGGEVHVLGYYLQYKQPDFQNLLRTLRDARVRRGQRMVELLNEEGVHISWDRVRAIAQGSVGRPHVAKALVEAGYARNNGEAFDKYIGNGKPAYVPRYKLSPVDAVRLIASASGLPVMAHPITLPGLSLLREWLPELRDAGLVGLETYYGPYTAEQEQALLKLAKEYELIPTGGTDYHGPDIHPTPLGGRYVPRESVERLKAAAEQRRDQAPPVFILPTPVEDR